MNEPITTTNSSQVDLLVTVDDSPTLEIVWRELHYDSVFQENTDVVLVHLAIDIGEHLIPVAQLRSGHRVRQGLDDAALNLNCAFSFSYVLHVSLANIRNNPGASWEISTLLGVLAVLCKDNHRYSDTASTSSPNFTRDLHFYQIRPLWDRLRMTVGGFTPRQQRPSRLKRQYSDSYSDLSCDFYLELTTRTLIDIKLIACPKPCL